MVNVLKDQKKFKSLQLFPFPVWWVYQAARKAVNRLKSAFLLLFEEYYDVLGSDL